MPEALTVPDIGVRMTDIPLLDAEGVRSRLADEISGAPAVLFFMRAADCPVCLGHVRTLTRLAESGRLHGVRVFAIAPGGAEAAAQVRTRNGAAVEARASGTHHADLGLGRFLMLQHSGTFVLDADGTVLSAVTSALPTASFSKSKVLAALEAC